MFFSFSFLEEASDDVVAFVVCFSFLISDFEMEMNFQKFLVKVACELLAMVLLLGWIDPRIC